MKKPNRHSNKTVGTLGRLLVPICNRLLITHRYEVYYTCFILKCK